MYAILLLICNLSMSTGVSAAQTDKNKHITPIILLDNLKNGTHSRAQLTSDILWYMRQQAKKTEDSKPRYNKENNKYIPIITYIGEQPDWATVNKRTLLVLSEIVAQLESPDTINRTEGLDALTKLMFALEINTTPQKQNLKSLRLLIGYIYFFPNMYRAECKKQTFLPERMLKMGSIHAIDCFELGQDYYPLGIEAYKHLLKTHATSSTDRSQCVYWISWGYLQLKEYDQAIVWAKKMPPSQGMTEAPKRLQQWVRLGKSRMSKKK